MSSNRSADYDVIAVGAGFAGISLSYHLREAGFNVKVFDRASDVGGTWAWNKYPGAATDSESYYYCLTFSKEVLQEWSWSKRYSGWEETQNYLKFVMDKFSLWPMFQLSTEVESAEFDNETGLWNVRTQGGETHTAKYFVSAMGMISQPVLPNYTGQDRFNGPIFHSSRWPEGLDVAGKRVGIIGAGATTVQMLPEVAKTAAQVTVFQRTPNFVLPAMQKDMTPEWEKEIKDNYDEIIAKARNHMFGMAFEQPPGRNAVDTAPEEVQRIFEEHWKGSFRWVFETFDDLLGSAEANQMASDFITSKIAEKVDDPELVELLTPKGYPLFAKRPPLDHGYYEAYNRDNVKLVDIKDREPIQEITETGIQTTENLYEFDIIVLATGFQAYTGALEAIDIRGSRRAHPAREVGRRVQVHHGRLRRRLPQLLHDHRPSGTVRQPANLDRAKRGLHYGLHPKDGVRGLRPLPAKRRGGRRVVSAHRRNPRADTDGSGRQSEFVDDGRQPRAEKAASAGLLWRRAYLLRQVARVSRRRLPRAVLQ